MSTVQPEMIPRIAAPAHLDASVEEVFAMMLGLPCARAGEPAGQPGSTVSAVVGFGGVLTGACILRASADAARRIAGHMTGTEVAEINATVLDATGELCNMLAGSWKARIPELAAHCALSVPAVITGHDYNLHVQAPQFELHHLYSAGDIQFEITLVCDGLR